MLPGITGGTIAALSTGIVISWGTSPIYDDAEPYSFSSVSFGDARADRRIFVAIHWMENGSTHRTVSSVTIGGVSATVHLQEGHTGGATGFGCAIVSAVVPTGASGTIAVTMSGSLSGGWVAINTFVTHGLASSSPFDTASDESAGTATDLSATINVPDGGFVLAVFTSSTNANGKSVSWTGVTEIYDEASEVFPLERCSAGIDTGLASQTGRTVAANVSSSTSDAGNSFIAVSWN